MRAMPLSIQTRPKKGCRFLVRSMYSISVTLNHMTITRLGILNNTKTSLGRSLLRSWLFRPSLSIPVITARHDAVASFLLPENLVTAAAIHNHLKGIKNVPRILGAMRSGKAGVGEWQGLVKVNCSGIENEKCCSSYLLVYLPLCYDPGRAGRATSSGGR
jgi:DNA mismatch repair ATPase MutS